MTNEHLEELRLENMKQCGFGIEAMKERKICTQCGNPSPVTQEFCKECGYRLPDKTLYDIYRERHSVCGICETVVAGHSGYCPQCGSRLHPQKIKKDKSTTKKQGG